MTIDSTLLQRILEGALMASGKALSIAQLAELFEEDQRPANDVLRAALDHIEESCRGRGYELQCIASGYRFQVVQDLSVWVSRLWDEKPQKYSRALLETLALIAYRQPITRGDIESIRGVAVSSNIVKTLLERDWARVVGHKDVPGRPAMYATTRGFLDYFNLKNLDDLPSLSEIRDLDSMNQELALEGVDTEQIDAIEASLTAAGFELTATTSADADSELDAAPQHSAVEGDAAEVDTLAIGTAEIDAAEIDASEIDAIAKLATAAGLAGLELSSASVAEAAAAVVETGAAVQRDQEQAFGEIFDDIEAQPERHRFDGLSDNSDSAGPTDDKSVLPE
jgi:segregation and condensation protein B